jgi:hypothetical protein
MRCRFDAKLQKKCLRQAPEKLGHRALTSVSPTCPAKAAFKMLATVKLLSVEIILRITISAPNAHASNDALCGAMPHGDN